MKDFGFKRPAINHARQLLRTAMVDFCGHRTVSGSVGTLNAYSWLSAELIHISNLIWDTRGMSWQIH